MDKKCEICGTMMYNVTSRRKYCSRQCNKEAEKARLREKTAEKRAKGKQCEKCGKIFIPKENGWTRKYCFDCIPDGVHGGSKLRKIYKKWAVEYKGLKCECCGYSKCIEALDFHHLDPKQKDFNISDSNLTSNWETIKKELDKCILICSNCHREIHAGIRTIRKE